MGNSLGRAPLGGSDIGGEQDYKSKPVGTDFSGQMAPIRLHRKIVRPRLLSKFPNPGPWDMHGGRREAVGNSLHGRAALGGSETEATTGWTAGKLWEMERRGASSEMEARDERGLGGGFFGTISINTMS